MTRNKIKYKIIITHNKRKNQTKLTTNDYYEALEKFLEINKNNKVTFPKRFTSDEKVLPAHYEMLLLKTRTETDKNRMIRNSLGQLVEEKNTSKNWVILNKVDYEVEEKFWVYGYDSNSQRMTFKELIKNVIMRGIRKKQATKQICYLNNKVIVQGDELELIICKNKIDGERLYLKIKELAIKHENKKLIFTGKVRDYLKSEMYDKLQELTGWKRRKLHQLSTRA